MRVITQMTETGDDGDLRLSKSPDGDGYVWPGHSATHTPEMNTALGIPNYTSEKMVTRQQIATWSESAFGKNARLPAGYDGEGFGGFSRNTGDIQAFVLDGKAYMIADTIAEGNEIAVFLHEVGAHIGFTPEMIAKASRLINTWKSAPVGSKEREVYDAVQQRMEAAGEVSQEETVAYAIEEATRRGVVPTRVAAQQKRTTSEGSVQRFIDAVAKYFKE
jgi:hypothetical protein